MDPNYSEKESQLPQMPPTPMPSDAPQVTPPVSPVPPTPPSPSSSSDAQIISPKPKRRFLKILLMFILFFGFVGTTSAAFFAYAVAYDKIDLPNKNLEYQITGVVMSLPFMPKTPSYVLARSVNAHSEQINSFMFDISASATSGQLVDLDFKIGGRVDYSDEENLRYDIGIDLTKYLQMKFAKNDNQNLYIKIDKLPEILLTFLNLDSEKVNEIMQNWIRVDTEESRDDFGSFLGINEEAQDSQESPVDEILEIVSDEEFLSIFVLSEELHNDESVFVLSANVDESKFAPIIEKIYRSGDEDELTDYQQEYLNEIIDGVKELKIEIKINKENYLVNWASLYVKMSTESEAASGLSFLSPVPIPEGDIELAVVGEISEYNQPIEVLIPETSITRDEFFSLIESAQNDNEFSLFSGNSLSSSSQSRDAQRYSDLLQITNAIYQFAAEHDGNLPDLDNDDTKSDFPTTPTCIGKAPQCFDLARAGAENLNGSFPKDSIVPTYIDEIPQDPLTGHTQETGYTIYLDTTSGRVIASALSEENDEEIVVVR